MLLEAAKENDEEAPEINWRNFSLAQANSKEESDWKAWEQPDDAQVRGILPLRAGEAARRQGMEAFGRFHMALLTARHVDRRDINDLDVVLQVAEEVGLDTARFREDLADRSILDTIARDHKEAAEEHGVFGTPRSSSRMAARPS